MKNRSLEFRIQQKLEKQAAADTVELPVKGGKFVSVPRQGFIKYESKSHSKLGAIIGGIYGSLSAGVGTRSVLGGVVGGLAGAAGGAFGGYMGPKIGGRFRRSKLTAEEKKMFNSAPEWTKYSPEAISEMQKMASAADAMAEQSSHGVVSISDSSERKQTYGEIWEKDDPGALGSPADANLIHYSDKQGDDNIYNGQPDPKDPEGLEIRDAIKAKLVEYNSQNVDQAIADQTNDETDYL